MKAEATNQYQYILYDNNTGALIVSEQPLKFKSLRTSMNIIKVYGEPYTTPVTATKLYQYEGGMIETFFMIPVNTSNEEIKEYDVYKGSYCKSGTSIETIHTVALNPNLNGNIYFKNEISGNYSPEGYQNTVTALPENIGGENIDDLINEVLNKTTDVSTQANTYVTNITNVYNTYKAGAMTIETADAQIKQNLDNLSNLASTPTATLKDAVNVTNALTYGQAVNDSLLQDKEEAFWETRDIKENISDEAQTSDQQEIDYLQTLMSETTKQISELSPSDNFTQEQISTANEIVTGVWENPIIKKIIPLAACFMVICVALGIRYKL